MEINYKAIGQRIRERRKKLNMTQEVLAEKAELSTSHIGNIENARENVSLDALLKIANALDVTCEYLIRDNSQDFSRAISVEILNALNKCDKRESEAVLAVVETLCDKLTKG